MHLHPIVWEIIQTNIERMMSGEELRKEFVVSGGIVLTNSASTISITISK